jgi:hypothetical protein
MGSQDDLKLLLMKAVNRKNLSTGRYTLHPHGGLSFLGRRYTSPGLLDRLRGKEFDIYYDRRDISVIYLFVDGVLVGEALCTEFMGRRVSVWEADAERRADAALKRGATAESLENRQRIQEEATSGKRIHSLETKRLEKQRQLDLQRQEIHPEAVQTRLQRRIEERSPSPKRSQKASILPPAVPQDDPPGTEVIHLPIRKRGPDHD